MHLCFMENFANCAKIRRKVTKKIETLTPHISEMAEAIWYVDSRTFLQHIIGSDWLRIMELHMCENNSPC